MVLGARVAHPAKAAQLGGDLLVDLGQGRAAHTTGGELDGQRYSIDRSADRLDLSQGLGRGLEHRIGALDPGQEKLGRCRRLVLRPGGVTLERQRGEGPQNLAVQADRFPTGRQDAALAVIAQHSVKQLIDTGQDVLAVVDEEQDLPVTNVTA